MLHGFLMRTTNVCAGDGFPTLRICGFSRAGAKLARDVREIAMKRPTDKLALAIVAGLSLAACGPAPQPAAPLPSDALLGDWIGVEGATLKIKSGAAPGVYEISERTLDGPLAYTGNALGAAISFEENGKVKTIRAGAGDDTGLKYLAGKTNCLVIESGRGFCR